MFIVNPLSGRSLMSLFSTHPPLEERIERLTGMPASIHEGPSGGDMGIKQAEDAWRNLSR
jgi:heat shock protein HtpX